MTEAWQKQPMVTLFRTIDATLLLEWRRGQAQAAGMTAVFATAMARVLARHPQLNGTIENDQIAVGPEVDLAVAVALDGGLVAPVIHAAHAKGLAAIGDELDLLVGRARAGQLQPPETEGATASLSNLGNFGISAFTPLLTPPQIAVLGVGAVDRVFRETPSGFAFRSEMHVSLTFDHRAVDGADGARFLQDLDAVLQAPGQLAEPVAAN
jgi:pyruvate dehydrogenase E2 component (dihydrolipoamide acetyltransferase)